MLTTFYRRVISQILSARTCLQHQKHTHNWSMAAIEYGKKAAAREAIDKHLPIDGSSQLVVGIGSGTTIVYAVERIVELVDENKLDVMCVPTSYQAKLLIVESKLPLGDIDIYSEVDICFDGADEVDLNLNMIKGGGGCLTQEKVVASCAKKWIGIADGRKSSTQLGQHWKKGIPIEVVPFAHTPVRKRIEAAYGGEARLRLAERKTGPVVTDNCGFIIDWKFADIPENWADVDRDIQAIPGVIDTGLFVDYVDKFYFGNPDGKVSVRTKPIM